MQTVSIYRPMISIYTSNISIYRTIETIAIVKILLRILLLYNHDCQGHYCNASIIVTSLINVLDKALFFNQKILKFSYFSMKPCCGVLIRSALLRH